MRRWGDEFVVHHALSNDTYRLDEHGGLVLEALARASVPLPAAEMVGVGLSEESVERALAALAELGFTTLC